MTWTAQQRRKRRAAALAEPFRQERIDERLRNCFKAGVPVVIQARVMGGVGTITELGEGHVVLDDHMNIPRRDIRRVELSRFHLDVTP